MTPEQVAQAAEALAGARRAGRVLPEIDAACRPATLEDGYRVQAAAIERLGATGGWKIGATSPEAQQLLGAAGPFCGPVLADVIQPAPATFPAGRFALRGVECEFAFRIGRDLPPAGAPYDRETVAAAVESLHPAIEVVDCRMADWLKRGLPSLIADDAVNGALVLGAARTDWRDRDLVTWPVKLSVNGEAAREGTGAAVLGHPLAALTWLADFLAARGRGLKAGEIVTTGTCCGIHFAKPGDAAIADFGALGRVQVTFAV